MVPAVRSFVLAATCAITLFFLAQSFRIGPREIAHTTRQSFQVVTDNLPTAAWRGRPVSRVMKVTALFGQENELYQAALRSHDEHNRLQGYEMRVLRERIVNNFWSKPAYLLSLVVEELAKPAEHRAQWLMWVGPDIILLNPHIPLEIFLPPDDLDYIHFLGTHDLEGLNSGVFFLHVHETSVRMLIDVLAMPRDDPTLEGSLDKDRAAMQRVLISETWRNSVVYQPRTWYNAYQLSTSSFEGKRGDLLVHFHDLEGDKWSAMSSYLRQVEDHRNSSWSMPLSRTTYEVEIEEYWARARKAQDLLDASEARMSDPGVDGSARRLDLALNYEADEEKVMNDAIDGLKEALGIVEAQKIT